MLEIFNHTVTVAQSTGNAGGDLIPMVAMMVVSFFIFYWFLMRPQNLKQKETENMLAALKKNDRVLTSGGIYGTVSAIKERDVTLRIDDKGAHMTIRRDAIIQVIEPAKGEASDAKDATGNGKKK